MAPRDAADAKTRRRSPADPPARAPADQPIPAQPAPRPKDAPRTMRELRLAREGKRRLAREAGREPAARGPPPRARPGSVRSLVLFGATGDLAHRKVIPALYQLWRTNLLPHEFMLVAVGRRPYDDDDVPRRDPRRRSSKYSRVLPARRRRLGRRSPSGSATSGSTSTTRPAYDALVEPCSTSIDEEHGHARQPALLPRHPAVGSSPRSSASSGGSGSTTSTTTAAGGGSSSRSRSATTSTRRCGSTARSARSSASRRSTASTTTWARRPSGTCWSSGSATASSSRSGTGATSTTCRSPWPSRSASRTAARSTRRPAPSRDILQNHLLQLLSLVAMEPPATFEADALRDEKVKVLRAIAELTPERGRGATSSAASTARAGSPRKHGRRATARRRRSTPSPRPRRSSRPGSTIDDWRWSGVPFYLRTGKRLPKRATEIAIQFKRGPPPAVQGRAASEPDAEPARDPDPARRGDHAAVRGQGARASGSTSASVTMDFTYGSAFSVDSPGRVRDAHPRRAARATPRCSPGPTRSRRRGASSTRSSTPGPTGRRPTSRTTTPGTWGPAAADELLGPRRPALAPDLTSRRGDDRDAGGPIGAATRRRSRSASPSLRWSARAHSIDEIETRARPDLGPART